MSMAEFTRFQNSCAIGNFLFEKIAPALTVGKSFSNLVLISPQQFRIFMNITNDLNFQLIDIILVILKCP